MWLNITCTENNKFSIRCVAVLVVVSALAICAPSIAGAKDKGEFVDNIRSIWDYICHPNDADSLMVDEEIDISNKGAIIHSELINKHKGNYSAGIYLKNFSEGQAFSGEYLRKNIFTLKIGIYFYVNHSLVLSKIVEGHWSPFASQNGGGLIFVSYRTPEDLPLHTTISCEVKIIEPDINLSNAYGPARFYIRQESDK